jgi:hypothetical protein
MIGRLDHHRAAANAAVTNTMIAIRDRVTSLLECGLGLI